MFIWSRALERLAGLLASVGPVCSSPLRGYNSMPDTPVSIIDFHGLEDTVIPYNTSLPGNLGPGPDGTVMNNDGYYYTVKMTYLRDLLAAMECDNLSSSYPTSLDGEGGWECQMWGNCSEGAEVVHCTGHWAHQYPLSPDITPFQIMWNFFKTHPSHSPPLS